MVLGIQTLRDGGKYPWDFCLEGFEEKWAPKLSQWYDLAFAYLSDPSYVEGTYYIEIAMFPVLRRIAQALVDAKCFEKVQLTDIEALFETSGDYVRENYERVLKLSEEKFNGKLDTEATLVSWFANYISNILISKCYG